MLPYRYQPLHHNDSIRILVLHPSSDDSDPLRCTIQHVRLSDASLEYEAVSYTWGDTTHQQAIYFHNGKRELRVGINCHNALQRLRQKHDDRLLWIDAICIDQGNLIERANQVRIMDEIFRNAFGVTVYLGEETTGSHILFEELAAADWLLSRGEGCDRPLPNDIIIHELDTLFQRSWFKRVWVLQEVYMNGLVTFMCGSSRASWEALRKCIFGYRNTRVTRNILPLALDLLFQSSDTFSTTQYKLWNMLYESRACLATDPRDRVFALRSLIGSGQSDLDPLISYVKQVEEIFSDTAIFLLPVLGLRLLTAVRHPHEMGMPSWIPDWSQNSPILYSFFDIESYPGDSDDNVPHLRPVDEQRHTVRNFSEGENDWGLELLVTGCRYSRIMRRSQTLSFNDIQDAEAQMKGLYLGLNNLREQYDLRSMPADWTMYERLGQEIRDVMSSIDGDDLHAFLCRYFVSYFSIDNDVINDECVLYLFEALQQCRIALLDNGELVIVPGKAQDGDMICIFSGADSPCVLRLEHGGYWTLVSGDCSILTDRFRFAVHKAWFMCDEYIAQNHDQREEFVIR